VTQRPDGWFGRDGGDALTDHDWDVDGVAGGSPGAPDGSVPKPPAPGSFAAANVVPFPGHWFGSVEDLIPLHPEDTGPSVDGSPPPADARTAPAEAAPPPAAPGPPPTAGDAPPATGSGPASTAADASDFWEGDAAALGELAVPEELRVSIPLLRSPGAAQRRRPVTPLAAAAETVGTGAVRASSSSTDPGSGRLRRIMWAGPALALIAGGVMLAQSFSSGSPSHPLRQGATAAVSRPAPEVVTETYPVAVTVTTEAPARRPHRRSARRKLRARRGGSGGHGSSAAAPATGAGTGATLQRTEPTATPPEPAYSGHGSTGAAPSGSGSGSANSGTAASRSTSAGSTGSTNASSTGSGATAPTGDCATQSPDSGCLP
jgi:hypothetical protein